MTALIIDTSGSLSCIALSLQGKLIQFLSLPQGRELSETLFNSIISLSFNKKIDFIAVGIGPGTFTGTRVGAASAQSLSYGWSIPLVPFSSLLLPDLPTIAEETYQSFLSGAIPNFKLVYISKTP